jgi:dihydroorotase
VHAGQVNLPRLLHALSTRPAEILGLPQGRLQKGAPADVIRFDPEEPYVLDPALLHSRSRNTPFDEARLQGVVKLAMVAGKVLHG